MIYAGIDVNIITHEKAAAAGPEAFGLWCWAMCWAQVHESDGRVPRILALRALGGRRNVMLAKRLVEVGLWLENDDGSWTIHNYAKKNQTAEEIQRKKANAKARKGAYLERQRLEKERAGNASGTRSGTQLERVPERPLSPSPPSEPTPPPSPPSTSRERPERRPMEPVVEPIVPLEPRVLGNDGEGGAAWLAWREGIKRVTGLAVSDLSRWDKPELVDFVNAHAGGLRGELLMAWISSTAETFAREHQDGYGLTAKRCKTWLDGGRKRKATVGNNIVQSGENRAWKVPEGF